MAALTLAVNLLPDECGHHGGARKADGARAGLTRAARTGLASMDVAASGGAMVVVCVLFQNTLAPPVPKREPPPSSPPARLAVSAGARRAAALALEDETVAALRVLEGCCLMEPLCREHAASFHAVQDHLERLLAAGSQPKLQGACLDALLALLLDSPTNQQELMRLKGMTTVARLSTNVHVDHATRSKCTEFIRLVVEQVLPEDGEAAQSPAWSAPDDGGDADRDSYTYSPVLTTVSRSKEAAAVPMMRRQAWEDVLAIVGKDAAAELFGSEPAVSSPHDEDRVPASPEFKHLLLELLFNNLLRLSQGNDLCSSCKLWCMQGLYMYTFCLCPQEL
eukprot:SM000213S06823  [mRNA]  locus=s213:136693:139110:+ [translate_table: standard]